MLDTLYSLHTISKSPHLRELFHLRLQLDNDSPLPLLACKKKKKSELLHVAQDSLAKAQQKGQEFEVGDKVMLNLFPKYGKCPERVSHRGFIPCYGGHFEVMKKVGKVAYKLRLPQRVKIHPIQ